MLLSDLGQIWQSGQSISGQPTSHKGAKWLMEQQDACMCLVKLMQT
jgi:hypothetical protein